MKSDCGHPLYWKNCYSVTFDLISPDSIAHPAKMAPALCFRILDHLKELGLLKDSDTILDPMGGTGLTAICAGAKGYKAITVELEEKFVNFQQQNKEYASRKLYRELDWTILQGDARKLSLLLNEIGNLKDTPLKVVTSPPYGDSLNEKKNTTSNLKREERLITAGHQPKEFMGGTARNASLEDGLRYSSDPANLGNLPDKPLKTLTSPPYESCDTAFHDATAGDWYQEKRGKAFTQSGESQGNISQERNETYLSAMLQVYTEIAKVSDVLAIVLKNPTRNGKLRRLDLDTIELLKQSGWDIHCQHRALLFEELHQMTLDGAMQKRVKGRMSFFKRLSWQNGQPVASWEDVLIAVRK